MATSQMSIGPGAFDAFLYAPVGEDNEGTVLTVLSALARLGLDPWNEAARLADLPRAAAAQALAKSIALLPLGNWRESDFPEIAARLVGQLPAAGTPLIAAAPGQGRGQTGMGQIGMAQIGLAQLMARLNLPMPQLKLRPTFWLVLVVMAIGWFYVLNNFEAAPPFETPTKFTQQ
jgi:hypothetical protein